MADSSGFLAQGGDLEPDTLLWAYNHGIFPWYSSEPIKWFCPIFRQVIFLEKFHVSQSLKKTIQKGKFQVTINEAFTQVMRECALQRKDETWITPEMINAYSKLHLMGYAVSAETWIGKKLVGGVYGVIVGRIFCAESMFYNIPSASKVALVFLADTLRKNGFILIDCQVYTENTARFGGEEIEREEYLSLLEAHKVVL